jgi:FkbH-like protein
MYETEANFRTESSAQLPSDATEAFAELRGKIVARTVLPWSEHCTECAWPTCYSTCDMYSPRQDGRCRRFVDGMVRVDCPTAFNGYLLKIRFKQWGKLWTPGNLNLHPVQKASRMEKRDYQVGKVLYQLPLPNPMKSLVVNKRYGMKKRLAIRASSKRDLPTCFLLECFNPMDQGIDLSLSVRSFGKEGKIPFQKLIQIRPGFQLVRIPLSEISNVVNLDIPFNMELIPNEIGKEITLYFGLMDFAHEVQAPVQQSSKVKCVVWDLDHTLWNGVLVEEGAANLQLKPGIMNIIEELDRRGILQSVASKNNNEEAIQVLRAFHLEEFFLYPQISWGQKGEAIKRISHCLNIGVDALLFVDDSEFELRQVESACPGVRVLDASRYSSLLAMEECQVPITAESRNRRKMYKVEQDRQDSAESFKDDYSAFLKHCNIQLTVRPLTEENLERVHELTQRTNQMNFSGNRYDREVLRKIMQTPSLDTYVLACEDRFGSYGIVGFGTVDNREPRMTDLMFSCRIQSKRVEHAFLRYIIDKYVVATGRDFHANYRKTPRNLFSGQVFADLEMQETGLMDGITTLVFPKEKKAPDDGIITVIVQNDPVPLVQA